MKKIIAALLGAATLMTASTAMALTLPIPSFTIGDVTFSDFTAVLNGEGFRGPTDLSGITITPNNQIGNEGFTISGSFVASTFPFAAVDHSAVDLLLGYRATSSGSLIHDVELGFNGGIISDPAFASVIETVYSDALRTNVLGQVSVSTPTPLNNSIILSESVSTIYVTKDIALDAWKYVTDEGIGSDSWVLNGYDGRIALSSITQTVTHPPVPEPSSIVLLGLGLLGLGIYGRHRARK